MTAPSSPAPPTLQIREVRSQAEVDAVAGLTLASFAEFMPPEARRDDNWNAYLAEQADAGSRAQHGTLLIALDRGVISGSVVLYLEPARGSEHWRDDDAMFRFLAVLPEARGRGIGKALFDACMERAKAAGKPRMALHTVDAMTTARSMYERAGFLREPEGDIVLEGITILAFARPL